MRTTVRRLQRSAGATAPVGSANVRFRPIADISCLYGFRFEPLDPFLQVGYDALEQSELFALLDLVGFAARGDGQRAGGFIHQNVRHGWRVCGRGERAAGAAYRLVLSGIVPNPLRGLRNLLDS